MKEAYNNSDTRELDALRERLALAEAELADFAYIVSHDLSGPIRALRYYAEALHEDCADRLSGDELHMLEEMAASAQRAQRMITGVLNYSRLGRDSWRIGTVDLNECVDHALAQLRAEGLLDGVQVSFDRDLETIQGVRSAWDTVALELIRNAAQFSAGSDAEVDIGSGDEAVLVVRDNGIGIDAAALPRALKIFSRLHHDHEYGGGIGLGLTMAKRIVELHGGTLHIESAPGQGCTVSVRFAGALSSGSGNDSPESS